MLPWDSSYMQICPLNQPPLYPIVFIVIPMCQIFFTDGGTYLTFFILGAQVTSITMSV